MTTISEEQRMKITGTVVAAILGCHPYLTEVEAQQKVLGNAPDIPESEPMRHGRTLERMGGFLDQEAEIHYGIVPTGLRALGEPNDGRPLALQTHPEHDFLAAHLDRMLGFDILEYKTTSVTKNWGPDLTDEVPLHVYWQVAHQLLVTPEAPRAHIQAFLGIGDMRHYVIERADASLPKLESKLVDWYQCHIVDRVPVEPDSEADARLTWPKESQKTKEASDGIRDALQMLCDIRKSKAVMDKREDEVRLALMKDLGHAEGYTHDGDVILRWKQRTATRLDVTKLKKETPEIYAGLLERHPKVSTTRAFTPVWTKLDKMFGREK